MHVLLRASLTVLAVSTLAACDTGPVFRSVFATEDARSAPRGASMVRRTTVRMLLGPTPPTGSTPAPADTPMPTIQGGTLPVVPVYEYRADVTGTGFQLWYWAYDASSQRTFLWGEQPMNCSDAGRDRNATLVFDLRADMSGSYVFLSTNCPEYQNTGCRFNAINEITACGTCFLQSSGLVCLDGPPS